MWEGNKNVPLGFGSFVDIEYIRALGLFQESDISHFISVTPDTSVLKDANEHLIMPHTLINIRDITFRLNV